MVIRFLSIFIIAFIMCGCNSVFFRSLNGTSNSIALSLPTDTSVKIQICEYLNGEKTTVRDNSNIVYKFKASSTNNYFGVIHTHEYRES